MSPNPENVGISEFTGALIQSYLLQEVIDKFGRYPQRNKPLGRENTPEEEEFLNNIPDRYKW